MNESANRARQSDDYAERIANRIAEQMVRLRGTGEARTIQVGDIYFQIASYEADQIMIEVPSNRYLTRRCRLSDAQELDLAAMGFELPDDDFPNWWIGLDDGFDHDILAAARTVTHAVVKIYCIPIPWLGHALGLDED